MVKSTQGRPLTLQLLPYIQFLLLAAVFSAIIGATTNFYSLHYSISGFSSLPRNSSTFALSIFNAYSGQIPAGSTPAQVDNSFQIIQQNGTASANITIFLLILATLVIIQYNIITKALNVFNKKVKRIEKRNDMLAGMLSLYFINALLFSQYLVSWIYASSVGYYIGVELFQVDAAATILFFSIIAVRAIARKSKLTKRFQLFFGILNLVPIGISFYLLLNYLGIINLGVLQFGNYFLQYAGLLIYAAFYLVLYGSSKYFLSKIYHA
jgi:hypothetical protein